VPRTVFMSYGCVKNEMRRRPRRPIVSDEAQSFRVTVSDAVSGENFRNRSRVMTFTVNIFVGEIKLIELPDVMLIDGRIQLPEKRKKTREGELRVKVVKPIYHLLRAIYDAVERTDWFDRYPDLPPLIPLVNRDYMADLNEPDELPPPRYRFPFKKSEE
jgi:hypothetical protein